MPDFITTSTTNQSTLATGQVVPVYAAGATSGVTFTAGSATAGTASTAAYVGYAVSKTYAATNTGASALTAGVLQFQGSNDGTSWYNTGSTLTLGTLAAGATVSLQSDTQPWKYVRATVSTAITTGGTATVTVIVAI